jgi:hypothetical protein
MLASLVRFLSLSTALREQQTAVLRQDSENELRGLMPHKGPDIGRDFVHFSQYPARTSILPTKMR